jgi:hypothetical protein
MDDFGLLVVLFTFAALALMLARINPVMGYSRSGLWRLAALVAVAATLILGAALNGSPVRVPSGVHNQEGG